MHRWIGYDSSIRLCLKKKVSHKAALDEGEGEIKSAVQISVMKKGSGRLFSHQGETGSKSGKIMNVVLACFALVWIWGLT